MPPRRRERVEIPNKYQIREFIETTEALGFNLHIDVVETANVMELTIASNNPGTTGEAAYSIWKQALSEGLTIKQNSEMPVRQERNINTGKTEYIAELTIE